MTNRISVCIECGGPTNELNEDEEGVPCPACSERLMESLPGIFHAPWGQGAREEAEANQVDEVEGATEELRSTGPIRPNHDPREPA